MDVALASLLNFYAFSTGRRLLAMQQVQKAALTAGFNALVDHCSVAIAHDRATRDLEARWSGQKGAPQFSPEAKQIDILVDAALGALRDGIDAQARASAPDDALGAIAVNLAQELFPKGVGAITTLPYVEELGELDRILRRLQDQASAPIVKDLGLTRLVARLVSLEQQYRAAIEGTGDKIAFGSVKDARAKGQRLLLQAVAMILGKHPSDEAADQAARATLLGPILKQNEAIREYLRTRRAVEDIDPDTGEVEPTPAPTAPPAATPAGQP
ncbi:hypothetical protein [Polyangium aurulentum]|uniref:hypothetical protein n=1 Tax=Polyangium aurulentum TaxID=2567896 RepID=UPI0010AEACD3|nr:hypothetical protein [Polyangium aurulentum]UQA58324.1 hypothetical protein E8A73_044950 [Polyangium aurulentum]